MEDFVSAFRQNKLTFCLVEKKYYTHYEGRLIDVLPEGTEVSFFFDDGSISLNVPSYKTQSNIFNECIELKNKTVSLVYELITFDYVYCYEIIKS